MFTAEQHLNFAIRELAAIGVVVTTPQQIEDWYNNNHRRYCAVRQIIAAQVWLVGDQRVSPDVFNRQVNLNAAINAAGLVRSPTPQADEGYW